MADRWHLLANLREALERLLTRKHTALPSVPHADDKVPQPAAAPAVLDTAAVAELAIVEATKDQLLRQQRRARRLSRYDDVMRLHAQGVSVRQIAQHMGMGRQTVRRYLNHGTFPEIVQRRKMPSILDRWEPYLLAALASRVSQCAPTLS